MSSLSCNVFTHHVTFQMFASLLLKHPDIPLLVFKCFQQVYLLCDFLRLIIVFVFICQDIQREIATTTNNSMVGYSARWGTTSFGSSSSRPESCAEVAWCSRQAQMDWLSKFCSIKHADSVCVCDSKIPFVIPTHQWIPKGIFNLWHLCWVCIDLQFAHGARHNWIPWKTAARTCLHWSRCSFSTSSWRVLQRWHW